MELYRSWCWRLQQNEVEDFYGPLHPEKETEVVDFLQKGTCIPEVTLRRHGSYVVATWDGDKGSEIKDKMKVVISHTHPKTDSLSSKSYTVANKSRCQMELHGNFSAITIDEDMQWRLDIEANYIPCLLYTSPSPRDRTRSRMPSSA